MRPARVGAAPWCIRRVYALPIALGQELGTRAKRDDRVEAFTSLLWEGVWEYSYVARATTPGSFVVPPARAEEMYSPETFGRTATDRLVVD